VGSVDDLDGFAAALRALRRRAARERGGPPLSYRELAARTGWAYGSFSGYFRGDVLPPADRLDTLLQLLGATDAEQAALATARDRLDDRRRGIAADEFFAFPDGDDSELIARDLRAVGAAYLRVPPGACLGSLLEIQARIELLRSRARRSSGRRRDLDVLGGVGSRMLSHACWDLSLPRAALVHAQAAFDAGERAGHDLLRAHARDMQAGIAARYGSPQSALRFAESGLRYLGGAHTDLRTALHDDRARVWSALGDPVRTDQAVRAADAVVDDGGPDEISALAGILNYDAAAHAANAATALVAVPDGHAAAERYGRAAIDIYLGYDEDQRYFGCLLSSYATVATCRVRDGDVEGAGTALGPLFELGPDQLIAGLTQALGRVTAELRRAPDTGSARQLRDRLAPLVGA
jgi:transcriptional regulator with XRE-family HTH domain